MQTALLLVITIFGWGLYHNFCKLSSNTLSAPAMQFIMAICWIFALPLYYLLMQRHPDTKFTWPGVFWCVAAFISTSLGTTAYMYALSKNDVSQVVGYATTYPILVMLIAVVFMGEHFSWQKFIGLILVLLGVFVSSR